MEITVVIPAYNAEATVGRAITSALGQDPMPREILVVDDGSTDRTAEVVAAYGPPVRLIRQENAGAGAARNRAAGEARGDWLAMLDADDEWLPGKLRKQAALIDHTVGVVHCRSSAEYYPSPREHTFETLWHRNTLILSTALIRREAFESVGGFPEDRNVMSVEDYNLWLRLAAKGWRIVLCPEPLYRYHHDTPGNLNSNVERFAAAELANVADIGRRLELAPEMITRKRAEICLKYGRELLSRRQPRSARRLLAESVRLRGPGFPLFWLAVTLVPPRLLDVRRAIKSGATL